MGIELALSTLLFMLTGGMVIFARFAAESRGLCDSDLVANATVAYRLPHRAYGGIAFHPTGRWRVCGWGSCTGGCPPSRRTAS